MITLNRISKIYSTKRSVSVQALNEINLTLPRYGLIFIVGQSGSGKTTLMNLLGGLDAPSSGEFKFLNKRLDGGNLRDLEDYRNKYVGFIFQDYNIINEINVSDNLTLGLTFQKKEASTNLVDKALENVMLKGFEKRYPNELSGGQLQRVAIARAL